MELPSDLFVSPDTGRPLRADPSGHHLVTEDGAEGWPIVNGIPDFVQRDGPDVFGEQARAEGWVRRNREGWKRSGVGARWTPSSRRSGAWRWRSPPGRAGATWATCCGTGR